MKKYSIARMNYIAEVGKFVSNPDEVNPNTGMPIKNTWKKERTVYFGNYRLTLNDQVTLAGTLSDDTRLIVTRNEYQLRPNDILKIPTKSFGYYSASYDKPQYFIVRKVIEDDSVNGFDLVTIERKSGYSE